MSKDLGTYNTLAFPSWALHMPWLREILDDVLVPAADSLYSRPLVQDGIGGWKLPEGLYECSDGPWWAVQAGVLGIAYTDDQTDTSSLVEALNQAGIPHDIYFDTGLAQCVCEQSLGTMNGLASRRLGPAALDETSLPDEQIVKRMSDEDLLALLDQGKVTESQDHLRAVIAYTRLIEPLDKSPLAPREQLVEAFVCLAGAFDDGSHLNDFVKENPGFVASLSGTEKDRALSVLCVHGSSQTLADMVYAGFVVDADAPRRIAQTIDRDCAPAYEKSNATMLTHLAAMCARNRAMDVLSEMEASLPNSFLTSKVSP